MPKPDRDSTPLRDGTIDMETGVVGSATAPELRSGALFRDRLIGVVRMGHPLSRGEITPARFAARRHIGISRRGVAEGTVDKVLRTLGLKREIATMVVGFSSAVALARGSDLIACVPERHTENLRADLHGFSLPIPTPEITVSLIWHPRFGADPAHRWLRGCVREACAARTSTDGGLAEA